MKAKKIIIAVGLQDELHKPLLQLKEMNFDENTEIHFVHVIPVTLSAHEMEFSIHAYPPPEERPRIEEKIVSAMKDLKQEIFPEHKNVHYKCLFDTNAKAYFNEYVEQQNADLVIVATRGKFGLKNFFDSSFAQHQLKHSPANVLILR